MNRMRTYSLSQLNQQADPEAPKDNVLDWLGDCWNSNIDVNNDSSFLPSPFASTDSCDSMPEIYYNQDCDSPGSIFDSPMSANMALETPFAYNHVGSLPQMNWMGNSAMVSVASSSSNIQNPPFTHFDPLQGLLQSDTNQRETASSPSGLFTIHESAPVDYFDDTASNSRPRSNTISSGESKLIPCPHPGCDKKFSRHYNLKSHMVCHSKERPHTCQVCGSAFARKHDLQRHIRTLHGFFRSYKCGSCSLSFVRMESLRRHMLNELHTDGFATINQGSRVVHSFTFSELEQVIMTQSSSSLGTPQTM